MASASPYWPDFASFYLFADLKNLLEVLIFASNVEVIAESKEYIVTKHKWFFKEAIEMLVKYWNYCIALGFIGYPTNFSVDLL